MFLCAAAMTVLSALSWGQDRDADLQRLARDQRTIKARLEKIQAKMGRLAEKLGGPVVTTMFAKGVFPMDHPQHMGIHIGPFSAPAIQKRVRDADLVLALGTQLTNMNLGAAKPQVLRDRSVWAASQRVNVSFHTYTDVMLRDFVGDEAGGTVGTHAPGVWSTIAVVRLFVILAGQQGQNSLAVGQSHY